MIYLRWILRNKGYWLLMTILRTLRCLRHLETQFLSSVTTLCGENLAGRSSWQGITLCWPLILMPPC